MNMETNKKPVNKFVDMLTKNKILIIVVLDFLLVIGTIILLTKGLASAQKLSELRSLEIKYDGLVTPEVVLSDLLENEKTIADLASVFIDEQGFIEYVEKLDALRAQGAVTKFSFVTQEPVKDKQGFFGLPLLLEFEGTGVEVEDALTKVQMLPVILKPIDVEIFDNKGEDKLIVKMSAFLYTNEKFSGN